MAVLTLDDLVPSESTFILSTKPGKVFTLRKFSLREQIWAKKHFGNEWHLMFQPTDIERIAELSHHLLKDASEFPTFLDFAESIVTVEDKLQVIKGMLGTIGISQPVIEKTNADEEAKKLPKPIPPEK